MKTASNDTVRFSGVAVANIVCPPATTTPERYTVPVEAVFTMPEAKANLLYYQDDELDLQSRRRRKMSSASLPTLHSRVWPLQ